MKNKLLLISLFILCFGFINTAKAEECTYAEQNEISAFASNVKMSYEFVEPEEDYAYFNIKILNINDNIQGSFFDPSKNEEVYLNYSKDNQGIFNIRSDEIYEKREFVLKIYSTKSNCATYTARTLRITTPRYNPYYDTAMCIDAREFSLCQKWSDFNFSPDELKLRIDNYKKRLEVKKQDIEKDKSIYEIVKNFIINNYLYFVIGASIIVIVTVIIIIIVKKRRVI